MGRLWEMGSEAGRLHASHGSAGDSGTLKRYLLDPVVPVLALMAMAALTTVMLTLVVGAVADMGQLLEGNTAGEVLQPGWYLTQASGPEQGLYYGSTATLAGAEEPPAWLNPQAQQQYDSSHVYSMSE
ncbi:MAG: hypothetical protein A2Y76_06985 [Planctomycetes bacterium RBG_13_60_9]|nr:MAG: hypothetical protein A2Y76_06985 [Planctomycetes bacterium RBG_13_60_9]